MEKFNEDSIKLNELIKIASKTWPDGFIREISGAESIKTFYNNSYNNFKSEIEEELEKFHPASWVRIGYIELEKWTYELYSAFGDSKNMTEAPYLFIPIGRYGWRYIVERSLENLEIFDKNKYDDTRPEKANIDRIFTLLIGLVYSSELSNYLHYFKNNLKSSKIIFSANVYSKFPELNIEEKKFFDDIISYINTGVDYKDLPEFKYLENELLLDKINDLLNKHYQFCLDDIDAISNVLRDSISPRINATNLIMPTDEFVILINEYTGLPTKKIKSIVDFIFFDTSKDNYEKRDFLRKSQNVRMINYAGCQLKLDSNFRTIYDDKAAKKNYIVNSEKHCIISFLFFYEWRNNFISRIVFGRRIDLKEKSEELKIDISKIEQYFHRNIFENAVNNLLIKRGLECRSLEKIDKKEIPCGEIDGICVDNTKNLIYILESKNFSPSIDARDFAQNLSDHFSQRKYHKKFLKKINWVKSNTKALSELFPIDENKKYNYGSYYVTGNSSPLKFLVDEYNVLTFSEFNDLLNNRYE